MAILVLGEEEPSPEPTTPALFLTIVASLARIGGGWLPRRFFASRFAWSTDFLHDGPGRCCITLVKQRVEFDGVIDDIFY